MSEYRSQNYEILSALGSASPEERQAFLEWVIALMFIRNCNERTTNKLNSALSATKSAEKAWPLLNVVANELTRRGWDPKGNWARWALSGGALGSEAFDIQAAGMGGLGSATGLPVWVILGSGAAFLSSIIEEMQNE